MRRVCLIVALAAGLAAVPRSAAAIPSQCDALAGNLVVNCGFETGSFSSWTLSGNTGFTDVGNAADGFSTGVAPHSGTFQANFGGVGSIGLLTQNIATTPGHEYDLQFWLADDPGCNQSGTPNCEFNVSWGGVTRILTVTPASPRGYTNISLSGLLGGPGASTALQFSFRQDPEWFHLDDVAVEAVPEPASLLLLGTGLLGLASKRFRIKK